MAALRTRAGAVFLLALDLFIDALRDLFVDAELAAQRLGGAAFGDVDLAVLKGFAELLAELVTAARMRRIVRTENAARSVAASSRMTVISPVSAGE